MSCWPRSWTVECLCGTGSSTGQAAQGGRSFMQPKYDYRRRLPHIQKDNRPIFITSTTDHRWELPSGARTIVLECCLKENGKEFQLHTAVVMPDHAHLLLSPLRDAEGWNFSLPQIMHSIKGASARRTNVLLGRSGPVWQEDSFAMFCDRTTVLLRRRITSAGIRLGRAWSRLRMNIPGSGEVRFRYFSRKSTAAFQAA